jgi:hypothetical protein
MACRKCGRRSKGRLCRQCEIEQRAEERARANARLDEDDEDDEGEDPVPLPDGGEEPVFVAAKASGGSGVLHTNRGCPHLKHARKVFAKPRSSYPDDHSVCERCRGVTPAAGGDNSGPWERLDTADPDDLVTDGGVDQPISQAELERRAKSAGTAYLAWCGRADVDPDALLTEIRGEFPSNGDVVTDGGRVAHPVDSVLTHAGVGDQSEPTCPNGSVECAKPGTAPCFACLTGGGEDA